MTDTLLVIPDTPAGVDPGTHLRNLLMAARADAAKVTKRLHLEPSGALRDRAADASTTLRELRRLAQAAIEGEAEVAELTALLGTLTIAVEFGEHVLMSNELLAALKGDETAWGEVDPHALAIGEMCGGAFVGFVATDLAGRRYRLAEVESAADVPLMHAIMRAMVAGVRYARSAAPAFIDAEDRLDELLGKTLDALGPVRPDATLRHLRFATITSSALWNLARIAQRDDLQPGAARAWRAASEAALAPIRADTVYQQRRLRAVPDYEHAFDVGVAFAIVIPILTRCAERSRTTLPLRADPIAWSELLAIS